MTKKLVGTFAFLLLLCSYSPAAQAASHPYAYTHPSEGRPLGLGIILGDPTGFTGKYWTAPTVAVDFGFAFSFEDYTLFYADYLFHFPGVFKSSTPFTAELKPYVGVGAIIAFSTNDRFNSDRQFFRDTGSSSVGAGVRIPLGIDWPLREAPITIFVELAPGMSIVPSTSGFLQGGIGARYFF